MLEAYPDEQNILLKPLDLRRLGLLTMLDLCSQRLKRQLKQPSITEKEHEAGRCEGFDQRDGRESYRVEAVAGCEPYSR